MAGLALVLEKVEHYDGGPFADWKKCLGGRSRFAWQAEYFRSLYKRIIIDDGPVLFQDGILVPSLKA